MAGIPGRAPAGLLRRGLVRLRRTGFLLPTAVSGYLWLKGGHPALPGWPCPLRALTGIPCPTCFLTRATEAALRGDLEASLQAHAFGPPLAAALLGWSLLALRRRRLLPGGLPRRPLLATAAALLAYWLARLALQWGLGIAAFPSDA